MRKIANYVAISYLKDLLKLNHSLKMIYTHAISTCVTDK